MASEKVKNLSEEKTHPEHKYSVTFVSKVGTFTDFKLSRDYFYELDSLLRNLSSHNRCGLAGEKSFCCLVNLRFLREC